MLTRYLLYFKWSLLGLLVFTKLLTAQQFDLRRAQLDSLMQIPASGDASIDADRFNNIAWEWRYFSTDTALIWATKAMELSADIELRQRQVANTMASIYRMRSQSDSAIYFYDLAFQLAKEGADTLDMARYLNNRSLVLKDIGQLSEAAELLNQAMELRRQVGDSSGYFGSMINMAVLVKNAGQTEKAIEYYNTAGSFYRRANVPLRAIITDINASLAYQSLGQVDKGIELIERALSDMNKFQLLQYEGVARSVRGDLFIEKGFWEAAIPDLIFALDQSLKSGELVKIAESATSLANAYLESGQIILAKKILQENEIRLLEYPKLFEQRADNSALLVSVFEQSNDWKNAFEYANRLLILNDSLKNRERTESFAEQRALFETELKEEQIARQELELQLADQKLANLYFLIVTLLIIFVVAISFVLIWRKSLRQRHQLEKVEAEVRTKKLQLQTMVQTQEKERSRMARELHDGVVQQITALLMESRKSDTQLTQIESKLDALANEVRGISHEIMPRALQENLMVEAVEQMSKRSLTQSGIDFTAFHSVKDEHSLSDELRKGVYRIAQEMIQNIIKHSSATKVDLSLIANQERLLLSISDNGKGIDPEAIQMGLGLKNMDVRAKLLGGRVEIKPNQDRGTEALLWVPNPYSFSAMDQKLSNESVPTINSFDK